MDLNEVLRFDAVEEAWVIVDNMAVGSQGHAVSAVSSIDFENSCDYSEPGILK